jgi:hypothetical protein
MVSVDPELNKEKPLVNVVKKLGDATAKTELVDGLDDVFFSKESELRGTLVNIEPVELFNADD